MTSAGVRVTAAIGLTYIAVLVLGTGAIAWGAFMLPIFWQQASPKFAASRILQGDTFKIQTLTNLVQQTETDGNHPFCNPVALRNDVVLHLAILNQSIAVANQALVQSSYRSAYDATRKALSCAPADSFIWLTLFWLDVGKNGLKSDYANYLRLSYAFGPNEAWIALWRNRLAFAFFERLPPDLSNDAVNELLKLVDTRQLYQQTVQIFQGAPPEAQHLIVEQLQSTTASSRKIFAKILQDTGFDSLFPKTARPDARPWR